MGIYYEIIRSIFCKQQIKTLLLSNEIFCISLVILSFLLSAYCVSHIRVTGRLPLNFVLRVYSKA